MLKLYNLILLMKIKKCYFQRIKLSNFYLNDQVMIIKLYPEPCYSKIDSVINAGLLKAKIILYNNKSEKNKIDINKFKDGETEEERSENGSEKINLENIGLKGGKIKDLYMIVCVVYMCRYLISSDNSGNNDPYVRITCVDTKRETSIKHDTINGIWNETLIFDGVQFDLNKKSTWPILLTEVLDYDKIGKDDLLGTSYIWLSDSPYIVSIFHFLIKYNNPYVILSNLYYLFLIPINSSILGLPWWLRQQRICLQCGRPEHNPKTK